MRCLNSKLWAATLLVGLGAILPYPGRLSGPFLLDDQLAIVDNPVLRARDLSAFVSPPSETAVVARPLVQLSFALDYALFGPSARAFHAINLTMHALCTCLLFVLLYSVLATARVPESIQPHAAAYAFITALCFGVHPLGAELALYASQRSELMVAWCLLLTLLLLVRHAHGHPARWYWVSLLGLLGAASKEVYACMLPIALAFDRAFLAGSMRVALRQRLKWYLALSPSLLVLCALQLQDPRPRSVRFAELDYVLAQAKVVPRYFVTALWPARLSHDYGPLWPNNVTPAWAYVLGIAVTACVCIAIVRRHARLGFLLIWIFASLAASSSVFSIRDQIGADRRFYIPLAALLAYLVVGIGELSRRRKLHTWATSLAAIIVVALAARTRARTADWQSARSLWQSSVQARPDNARAHYQLAQILLQHADRTGALEEFQRAITAHEAYPEAQHALAQLLMTQGQGSEALLHLQRAAALAPDDLHMRLDYASGLGITGRTADAVHELRAALRIQPDSLEVHRRLAVALTVLGRRREAEEQARWLLSRGDHDRTALEVLLDQR